jgi:ketosteroid isomerase-like protein
VTTDEVAVLEANDGFYRAFTERDAAAMDDVWAHERPITCVHPGWDLLVGREAVMTSWQAIFGNDGSPPIQCLRPRAWITGDASYVVCLESSGGGPPALVATNMFVREGGRWRMVHHHAGPLATPPHDDAIGEDDDSEPTDGGMMN